MGFELESSEYKVYADHKAATAPRNEYLFVECRQK